jgi:hypothetical protein
MYRIEWMTSGSDKQTEEEERNKACSRDAVLHRDIACRRMELEMFGELSG